MAGRRLMRGWGRTVVTVAAFAAIGGCAYRAPAPAPFDLRSLETRHAALLDARRERLAGTVAELSLWLESRARRFPGAHATCVLGGADTVRLRVASSFGTAVDLAGAGESLFVSVPARRVAARLDAAEPPLGLPETAALAVRVAAATWAPPADAWRAARHADTLTVLRWVESGDSLELALGGSGLPRSARFARVGMHDVTVTYLGYGWHEGTPWPVRFDVADAGGALRLNVRVRRLSRAGGSGPLRWRVEVPAGAEALEPEELWQWIEQEWTP